MTLNYANHLQLEAIISETARILVGGAGTFGNTIDEANDIIFPKFQRGRKP